MVSDVLDRPGLQRLWDVVAERLQRNGLRPLGSVVLGALDRDERHALAGVLGRAVSGERVSIDLAMLDRRLRQSGMASGLVDAVQVRRGPLVDRPAERMSRRDARNAVWHAGRAALEASGLATADWVEPWLEDVHRGGALGRLPAERATSTLVTAVACIRELPTRPDDPPAARVELASRVAGSAHALDDGTTLASVVLRAVAAMTGRAYPSTPAGRRDLWRQAGVLADEVSTTVLTAGLRTAVGDTWLDDRTDAAWESHLTARDLRRIDATVPADGRVFVCENPRVLEAGLDRGATATMVCTQGQPAFVVLSLLDHLVGRGAQLHYHGDFDWPGIAIANRLVGAHHCWPWRMGAADYEAALSALAPLVSELPLLDGPPVEAVWDPQLTVSMTRSRRTIHEELVLDVLLADLLAGRAP